jgi:hypothetical protein
MPPWCTVRVAVEPSIKTTSAIDPGMIRSDSPASTERDSQRQERPLIDGAIF